MSNKWYARPVLFVADIDRSVDFYGQQLDFTESWRYEEDGKAYVAQVDRLGCELILSSQWPDKVGNGLMFISLDPGVLDALRVELEGLPHPDLVRHPEITHGDLARDRAPVRDGEDLHAELART